MPTPTIPSAYAYWLPLTSQWDTLDLSRAALAVLSVNPSALGSTGFARDVATRGAAIREGAARAPALTPAQRLALARVMAFGLAHNPNFADLIANDAALRNSPFSAQINREAAAVPTAAPAPAAPAADAPSVPDSAGVRAMLDSATAAASSRGLRRPMIRIPRAAPGGAGTHIRFRPSTTAPNAVLVTIGNGAARGGIAGIWNGTQFLPRTGPTLTAEVQGVLANLGATPAAALAVIGQRSGACCYCGRPLTDPRSIAHGYGPICAGHYGLPWDADRDAARDAQAVVVSGTPSAAAPTLRPALRPRRSRRVPNLEVTLRSPEWRAAFAAPAPTPPAPRYRADGSYDSGEE